MKNKSKCKHPGIVRRLLSNFSILGLGFAERLNYFSDVVRKVANTLKFEHYWSQFIIGDPRASIIPSYAKAGNKHNIWNIALNKVNSLPMGGYLLEFGTNNGGSLLYFWKNLPQDLELHGFDSFTGIPEKWDGLPIGSIRGDGYPSALWNDYPELKKDVEEEVQLTGEIPSPPQKNIKIHKGLFAHTFPSVMSENILSNIRMIHFDADIYIGTRPILDSICSQLKHKYYILFDEFYSVNHEFRAWIEFIEIFSIQDWRFIAITEDGAQALIEVNGT